MNSDLVLVPVGLNDAGLFALAVGEEDEERYWPLVAELHRRGTVAIFELASTTLNSDDPVARATAADVLGQLGFEADYPHRDHSVPMLVERVLNDDDTSVIECAITALGHLGDASGLPAVVGAASHADDLVRLKVAMALPSMLGVGPVAPDAPAVAALISLMRDDDSDVRDWATFGLGTQTATDSPEVRAALADRLTDADEDVRREALLGLARRRDDRAVGAALHVLADDDADERAVSGAIEAAALTHATALVPELRRREGRPAVDAAAVATAVRRCDPDERQAELKVVIELMRHIEQVAPWARVEISSEVLPFGEGGVQIVALSGRRELTYQLDPLLARLDSVAAVVGQLVADGALRPTGVDPEVWVENEHGRRCYLMGNAHTHLGRMLTWVDDLGYLFVSKYEIVRSSQRAADWVAGFIASSEPELEVFLGRMAPLPGEPTDEDEARWAAALDHYRETGTLRTLDYVPTLPLPESVAPGWAWTVAGHQVYRWDGQAWCVTGERVEPSGEVLAPSACRERGHHSMAVVGDVHIVCEDCGSTTEVEPG